jgi:Icc-related predicted phosphoesterase
MRVRILSDLHLEFGEFTLPEAPADLVILAGDVHVRRNPVPWILKTFPETPLLYIAGNHEFYGEKFPRQLEKLRAEAADTKIHFLENEALELGGYRFFGCTLWTDMDLFGDVQASSIEASALMNDYRRIRLSHPPSYRKLRPADTRARHILSLQAMEAFLTEGDPRKSIVVTHHAPSILSLPPRRRSHPLSCAYASHLDDFIKQHRPLLWIHGHIHHSQDYTIAETRILSNPHGYIDEPNPSFDPRLVIKLP